MDVHSFERAIEHSGLYGSLWQNDVMSTRAASGFSYNGERGAFSNPTREYIFHKSHEYADRSSTKTCVSTKNSVWNDKK